MAGLKYFCGLTINGTFQTWNKNTKVFGSCFQWLCLSSIGHVIFAIVCAYLIGIHQRKRQRNKNLKISNNKLGVVSILLCYLQLTVPVVSVSLSYVLKAVHPPAFVLSKSLMFSTWLLCLILHHVAILKERFWGKRKESRLMWSAFSFVVISTMLQLYSSIKSKVALHTKVKWPGSFEDWCILVYFVLNLLYFITHLLISLQRLKHTSFGRHLPSLVSSQAGIQTPDQMMQDEFRHGEEDALLATPIKSYDTYTFRGTSTAKDHVALGFAEEGVSCVSKFFFWWANPLMKKGRRHQLKKPSDLFFLPHNLDTKMIKEIFLSILRLQKFNSYARFDKKHKSNKVRGRKSTLPSGCDIKPLLTLNISVVRALKKAFGLFYFSIGILKFLADCIAFAGPILLNYLVSFMENRTEPIVHGYYYAIGLFVSTFLGAALSAHFSYQVNKCGLQFRAALVTTVYEKALSVSLTTLSTFSSGQIINFMSTDTDRVVNFCNSFHQFWSLPFQIAVSLYLLYQQVGLAFLAGLGFALLLIPVNRWLAIKIAALSKDMMQQKDNRVKMMTECLFGIRVIKFYAWEDNFKRKIEELRQAELKSLKGRKYLDAWCVFFWATTPVLISILTFTTYVLMGNQLTAAKVFTSIALFSILIAPLNAFPWVINGLMEAWVSAKRIEEFLCLQEINKDDYYSRMLCEDTENALEIEHGKFRWRGWTNPRDINKKEESLSEYNPDSEYDEIIEPFSLRNINLQIRKGDLVGVIGKVGSGKSSLLSAITAEIEKRNGQVLISDDLEGFGYVAQEPWIQHMTIRDNILFGKPFYQRKYDQVIKGCALEEDLKIFPAGDMTEVGEHGVTLSGGQKARIGLARAVYQDKDIYLLDDPLASVDSHVASHLFRHCIMGLLRTKTRVLCTHHTKHLWEANSIIVLNEGKVALTGSPDEILSKEELVKEVEETSSEDSKDRTESFEDVDLRDSSRELDSSGGLVKEEKRAEGVVAFSVYKSYWKSVGHFLATSVMVFLFLMQGGEDILITPIFDRPVFSPDVTIAYENLDRSSRNISDWWLAYWISNEKHRSSHTQASSQSSLFSVSSYSLSFHPHLSKDVKFYLMVYGGIAAGNTVFTLFRSFLFAYGGIQAAKRLHTKLLNAILGAPVAFFDITPIGRIINRFSSDMYCIDDSLPFMMNIFLAQSFGVFGTIVVTCYGIPWFTAVLVPLGAIYYYTQNYYRHTSSQEIWSLMVFFIFLLISAGDKLSCDESSPYIISLCAVPCRFHFKNKSVSSALSYTREQKLNRELKRLSTVTLSPIYEHFSETLSGLSTIRSFRESARFSEENETNLDLSQRSNFSGFVASQWLMLRLQLIGVAMVTAVSFLAVFEHHFSNIDPGLVGLAISYALSVTSRLSGLVTSFTETEKEMVSVERAMQYIEGTDEENGGTSQVDRFWPYQGQISFRDVTLVYRHGLPPALNRLSFYIKPGEKVGICGRTGSGKSSLFLVLFSMVPLEDGEILIDGVDISRIPLKILRSRLSIIPQDPFLFDGTIRENLDPFGEYSDAHVWAVIERCHLQKAVADLGGLNAQCGERGQNFSVGQRQLVCLARALLKRAKIICIDEATASVDFETDKLIQETIKTEFKTSTVLTIAHRIETILDNDRVLVLDKARIMEFGRPADLLSDTLSLFYSLVHKQKFN